MTMQRFGVLGAGSWGTALALVLARNGHQVAMWGREDDQRAVMRDTRMNPKYLPNIPLHDNIEIVDSLEEAVSNSDHVLIVVPSHAFKHVLQQVHAIWPDEAGIIWATKGLDPDTGEFLSNIAADLLSPNAPRAILTGPSFAKEVGQDLPTAVIIASDNTPFAQSMQQCFQADMFRIYLSDDLIGAQLGGAIKNILAVAVGMAEGMGYGMNAKAGLMTRGLAEMMRLGQALGAQNDTMVGLSGLGDLILTCSDNQSRNRRFGLALGSGDSVDAACDAIGQVVEGIQTTKTIFHLAQKQGVSMPITEEMYHVLYEGRSGKQAVDNLLGRQAQSE